MIRRWKSFLKIQILVLETDRMRNKKNKSNRKDELKTRIVENKRVFTLYIVLRLSVILIMIAQFFNGNYENFFLCILTLILFTIPSFIEKNYHSVYLFGGDSRGNPVFLCHFSFLGHDAPYPERLSGGGDRFFHGGYFK